MTLFFRPNVGWARPTTRLTWWAKLTLHFVAFTLILTQAAFAVQSDNLELLVLPVPGKVAIDGKLDEWDLSGTILSCPDSANILDTYAVRSAAMYDGNGLYLSFRWVDQTPLMNMVDPDEPAMFNQGWHSDCLQLRILTDTQVHITAWQYQPTGKMMMDINYDQPVGPNRLNGLDRGAKMAFLKNPDGKGYVQELFIPWKLLSKSGKSYVAGESFTMGLHFNWGGGDNHTARAMEWTDLVSGPGADRNGFYKATSAWGKIRLSESGHVHLRRQPWERNGESSVDLTTSGPIPIKYDLPSAGAVTLVIEDANGKRVRNLISGFPRKAGVNVDYWDGLNDAGAAVPAGSYRWRGLINPGLSVRYKAHLFATSNPPWRNADGTGGWGADHSAPQYLAVSGDRVFLLYGIAEGGSALVCCDLHGNKLWGQGGAFQGGGAVCASDANYLYYADNTMSRSEITRVDAATGKAARFAPGVATIPTGLSNDSNLGEIPTGMAVHNDRLYLACARRNAIRVFNLATGKLIQELQVPAPFGLAFDKDGRLLAATENLNPQAAAGNVIPPAEHGVIRVEEGTGAVSTLIDGLNGPRGLTVAKDGTIYLVNAGTNQVLAFSADGKNRLREIGDPGGRLPVGKWNNDGMLSPVAVGIDEEGMLWVAESDPVAKRLSRWDRSGHNIGQWLGPTPYGGDGIVDVLDRTRIYSGGLEFRLDWETGESHPVWTHLRGAEQGQPVSAGLIATGSFWFRQGRTVRFKDHDYLCYDRGLICIKRGEAWVPAASVGYVKGIDGSDCLLWSDRNGDGKVQPEEIVTPTVRFDPGGAGGWGAMWMNDLSCVRRSAEKSVCRISPSEFAADGVPIFDRRSISAPISIPVEGAPVKVDDNAMIAFYENSNDLNTQKRLRENPLGDMTGIKGYDLAGNLIWNYPQPFSGVHGSFKAPLPTRPGQVIGTIYVMGVADMGNSIGKIVCFNGYYGQRFLFTTDGLFAGALFKDGRTVSELPARAVKEMPMDDASCGAEAYGGTFSRNSNGEVYLTSGFFGPMVVIMGVDGLDHLKRLPGNSFGLTQKQIDEGLAARRAGDERRAAEEAVGSTLAIRPMTPSLTGNLKEWDLEDHGVRIEPDSNRKATAGLAHDQHFLYAAFDVQDPNPWMNAGNDEKVMFLNGSSVDIQLGLVAGLPGNCRISIAPQQGKRVVMLYQPVVAGFKGQRVPFVSPIGREEMDRVERLDAAQVVVQRRDKGYFIEAAIPLSALPWKLTPGTRLRGDVGVLFSDNLGAKCVLRAYWSNKDTNITSDLPSEARLQPRNWGTVSVE